MLEFFYRGSKHAIEASKPEMLEQADWIEKQISTIGAEVELVAVNRYYKLSFIGHSLSGYGKGRLHHYSVIPYQSGYRIRQEYEFRGCGGDPWEQTPNYVQIKDLELGQMELF